MPDCREIIASEEYADFIIEAAYIGNFSEEDELKYCVQDTNYRYVIAYAPINEISPVSIEEYSYSEIPKLFGLMDSTAVAATGAIRLQRKRGLELTGRDVIVGFIDTGIDYRNKVFQNATGQTRIISIWDQTDQSGNIPEGLKYGSEYTQEDINRALSSDNPYEVVPTRDTNGHGTFMAGVACGSEDIENDFVGAANESLIAMVKLKPAKQYLRNYFLVEDEANKYEVYQENDIMLAVTYLQRLAVKEKKTLVIVLGVGSGNGQRAGETVLSQMLSRFGEFIGNCVVVCGGNEGNQRLHYQGKLSNGDYEDVELRVGNGTSGFSMEIWGNAPDILSVSFISPSGEQAPRIPARVGNSTVLEFLLEKTVIDINYSLMESGSGAQLIFMRFIDPTPGVWIIRVYGQNLLEGNYNMWLPIRQFIKEDTYFLKPSPDVTLVTPATADTVITVSAYDHTSNALYINSSRGFTSENAVKPDITAPGVNVYGPGINNNYIRKTGTSVAAALVAGNCAQLMQWGIVEGNEPQMKTNYIKNFLIRGAIRDRNIAYPSKEWGYGKVNIYETFNILAGQ